MIRRAPLRLGEEGITVESDFTIPEARYRRWLDVFGGHDPFGRCALAAGDSPLFSYHSAADTFMLFALAKRLGVPFRNILHASTETARIGTIAPGRPYSVRTRYLGAEQRRNCAALLHFRTEVYDGLDDPVLQSKNSLYVGGLPQDHWEGLKQSGSSEGLRRKKRLVRTPEWSANQVVGERMGREFGLLSGDLNPLHTSTRLARALGHPTGFIQGMCAYNLTVAALRRRRRTPLTEVSMKFSRPFYIGTKATLHVQGTDFEWVDDRDKVLGYGTFSTTTPTIRPRLRPTPTTRTTRTSRTTRRVPRLTTQTVPAL